MGQVREPHKNCLDPVTWRSHDRGDGDGVLRMKTNFDIIGEILGVIHWML